MTIQNAKNRNTPQRIEHIMVRKAWPMIKEKRKLTKVVMDVLAERVSRAESQMVPTIPEVPCKTQQNQ